MLRVDDHAGLTTEARGEVQGGRGVQADETPGGGRLPPSVEHIDPSERVDLELLVGLEGGEHRLAVRRGPVHQSSSACRR